VVAVNRDITYLKQVESELKSHKEELELKVEQRTQEYQRVVEELVKTNLDLEQFAFVASHDLKEPLRMISSYSDLLIRRIPKDDEAAEYLYFVKEGVSRMHNLIRDLLEYSRIGHKQSQAVETDCNLVLDEVLENLQILIKETGAMVRYSDLPIVVAVPSLVSQLFQNLLHNAVKFNRPGVLPEIEISAEKKGQNWLFSVKDNGMGIDTNYYDKVFVIFQRLELNPNYPGTGIGLAVCKRIVELHKGHIWVESVPGQGSTFYFTLPAAN
jgi:light-regulated signal transduction histidine kinase (bacteriophytochrome)